MNTTFSCVAVATTHQGADKFGVSKDHQCVANSACALAWMSLGHNFDTPTLDLILDKGNALYQSIPRTDDGYLEPEATSDRIIKFGAAEVRVVLVNFITSSMYPQWTWEMAGSIQELANTLGVLLAQPSRDTGYMFTGQTVTVAFFNPDGQFYLYEPHGVTALRTHEFWDENSHKSRLFRCDNVTALAELLLVTAACDGGLRQYTIHEVVLGGNAAPVHGHLDTEEDVDEDSVPQAPTQTCSIDPKLDNLVPLVLLSRIDSSELLPKRPTATSRRRKLPDGTLTHELEEVSSSGETDDTQCSAPSKKGGRPKKRTRGRPKTSTLSFAEQRLEAQRRYAAKNKEKRRETQEAYYENHLQASLEASQRRRDENPEAVREASQRHRDAHPEANREAIHRHRDANPEAAQEAARENVRRFRARHPEDSAMRHLPANLRRLIREHGPMGYWSAELLDNIEQFGLAKPSLKSPDIFRCAFCGARLFEEEKTKLKWCCGQGAYNILQLRPLFENFYSQRRFLDRPRAYNDSFAFCAMGVEGGYRHPSGLSFLKVEGRLYHTLNSLDAPGYRYQPRGDAPEQFVNNCALYLDDGEERRHLAEGRGLNGDVIDAILDSLLQRNPLVGQFRFLSEEPSVNAHLEFEVTSRATHGNALGDRNPGLEVHAVLNTEATPSAPRKICVWKHGDRQVKTLDLFSQMMEPLQYPLLFPDGDAGWGFGRLDNFGRKLSQYDYARCLLLSEPRFTQLGRLSQAWQVEMFARFEEERLRYITRAQQRDVTNNPDQHRAAPLDELRNAQVANRAVENNARRDIRNDETIQGEGDTRAGKIFLPNSFTGGPRYMKTQYENSMSLVARKGPPSLFVTFTYSTTWREHRPNCDASGRIDPATADRVFKIYLDELIRDLRSGAAFGKQVYIMHVIEMQMRGLPHAHIVLRLEGGGPTQDDEIDQVVRADIPSEEEAGGRLRELVLQHMIHGPCGEGHRTDFRCWDANKGRCSKFFPKAHCETTHADFKGFINYKRNCQNTGYVRTGRRDLPVHDGWVVPWNAFLLLKYGAHINVEIASTRRVVKYLFKYLRKGNSLQNMTVDFFRDEDEVKFYTTKRMIGASDACWRLLDFELFRSEPTVDSLQVHLEGKQLTIYRPNNQAEAAAQGCSSKLMLYFDRPDGPVFENLTYQQFFENFILHTERPRRGANAEVWAHRDGRHFITPRLRGEKVCRMYWVGPRAGELFYLRLLLLQVPCRGYADLLSKGGPSCTTFQEVGRELGLVDSDNEYDHALVEAATFMTAPRLRSFFVLLCNVEAPAALLWERHWQALCEDYLDRQPGQDERAQRLALVQIDRMLRRQGSSNREQGLPEVDDDSTEMGRELLNYGPIEQRTFVEEWEPRLSPDQRHVFDHVRALVADGEQLCELSRVIFVDGPGGYGKTALIKVLLAYVRGRGEIALAVASSGVAAQNMPGGSTAHSMFRLPLDLGLGTGVWGLTNGTQRAQLIKAAKIIIFDEAPMAHRFLFEMLDRSLRDLMNNDSPFGGKIFICCGDFRQIPPVVVGAQCSAQIVAVSLRSSYLWRRFQVFHLTTPQRTRGDEGYSEFLLEVGNGTVPKHTFREERGDVQRIALTGIQQVASIPALISRVYPPEVLRDPAQSAKRAILATVNSNVDEINGVVLERLPGEVFELRSIDTECREEGDDGLEADTHLMNEAKGKNVPDHVLRLKKQAVCLIMRNLNVADGLANGTKVIVEHISPRLVTVRIPGSDTLHAIPRITFKFPLFEGSPLTINRLQFPLQLAYAMTGHKSQGQTIDQVGVDFRTECFTHGQLYVLLSRVRSADSIQVYVHEERILGEVGYTKNIVYSELLLE